MKIIGGEQRGRKIKSPLGIRPTQGMIRKSLFDILGDISGLTFLELFAGSGGIGFEAASRQAKHVTLVECAGDCVSAIKHNIISLKFKACSLYPREVSLAIKDFYKNKEAFDIIFLDPPYYQDTAKKTLELLGECDILSKEGMIIVQHFKKEALAVRAEKLSLFKQKKYGDTLLSFYQKS